MGPARSEHLDAVAHHPGDALRDRPGKALLTASAGRRPDDQDRRAPRATAQRRDPRRARARDIEEPAEPSHVTASSVGRSAL